MIGKCCWTGNRDKERGVEGGAGLMGRFKSSKRSQNRNVRDLLPIPETRLQVR